MTPRKSGPEKRADELLELWMGDPADPPPTRRRVPTPVLAGGAILSAAVVIVLARFAADVLLIGLALAIVGVVLHVLGTWLAESDILSPAWFTVFVLGSALGAWALFYPADGLEGFGRYVPKQVLQFLEWSEARGWGQRVLLGPSVGNRAPQSLPSLGATAAPAPSSTRADVPFPSTSSAPRLSLTASGINRAGQAIVLRATLTRPPDVVNPRAIVFFDGLQRLGQAPLQPTSPPSASLEVRLTPGRHSLSASTELGWPTSDRLLLSVSR